MTDTDRFLAWAYAVSCYLDEKLPQLETLSGYYLFPPNYQSGNCSCVLYFRAPPSPFIEDVISPGLQDIHFEFTRETGAVLSSGDEHRLCWRKIPKEVALVARCFCPTEGPMIGDLGWPRESLTASWRVGNQPFHSPWSWDQVGCDT
jgi:hypothetical protein